MLRGKLVHPLLWEQFMESNKIVVSEPTEDETKKDLLKSIPSEAYPRLCVSFVTVFSPEEDAVSYEIQ